MDQTWVINNTSINLSKHQGAATRLKEMASWLLAIYCFNHRSKLGVQDLLLGIKASKDINEILLNILLLWKLKTIKRFTKFWERIWRYPEWIINRPLRELKLKFASSWQFIWTFYHLFTIYHWRSEMKNMTQQSKFGEFKKNLEKLKKF